MLYRAAMEHLNEAQRRAVEHDVGPMLVLAGAGSGKTRVVTARIARLLERGVPARAILAMTFTNKAAGEMHERVAKLVGAKGARELTISTFHSFGLGVISSEGRALGLRDGEFVIFDQSDATGLVRELLRSVQAGRRYDTGAILARISKAKNEFVEPDAYAEANGDEYDEITRVLYPRYVAQLRAFSAFDFDDLVCEPVRLFRRREEVLERWRDRFRYVMVDEYQDTNHAQLELVRLLGSAHRNVCVVGDDDQSIYAWRGADVNNILDFEEHFPGAEVVKLEYNYRSTQAILSVASSILSATRGRRHAKSIVAARDGGDKVQRVVAADPDVEAAFVGDEIKRLRDQGIPLEQMAVLYRSNLQSEPLEAALKERNVPFRQVGGTQFYDRKEVKDVIAYLKCALHPRDDISLRRILNYPTRGIGEAALERIEAAAVAREWPMLVAVERAQAIDGLGASALEGCRELTAVIAEARRMIEGRTPASTVARRIADMVGLKEDILEGSGSNQVASRRWGNVESLFAIFDRSDARHGGPSPERLAELLRVLSLSHEQDDEKTGQVVTLSTMHAAKGLEYAVVLLVGLEEGILPHARTLDPRATDIAGQRDEVEEERRLFYVSVTRAKDRLYLCHCKHRALRGKPAPRTPSRFLSDVPSDLVETRELAAQRGPSAGSMAANAAAAAARLQALMSDPGAAKGVKRPGR